MMRGMKDRHSGALERVGAAIAARLISTLIGQTPLPERLRISCLGLPFPSRFVYSHEIHRRTLVDVLGPSSPRAMSCSFIHY